MKISLLAVLAVVLISSPMVQPLMAQETSLNANIDVAAFQYDKEMSFVELYYAFPRSALSYASNNGSFAGTAMINAIIRKIDSRDEPILKTWRVPVVLQDTAGINDKMLIGKVSYLLEPGKHNLVFIVRDEARPSVSDSAEINFNVRKFSEKTTSYSDIELCSSIEKSEADPTNIFYKNTLEVIPNPTLLYGKAMPRLMYYAEMYEGDLEVYTHKTEIISSYGKTMLSKTKRKKGKHPSRVDVGQYNVGSFPSGVYTLILSYGDTSGAMRLSQSKKFFVFNPDIPLDTAAVRNVADAIAMQFASLSETELDLRFSMAQYLATDDEIEIWNELSGSEPKKKYLTLFWRGRDPEPATPNNEAYQEYYGRIGYCNEQFRTSFREGWRTDRGRVYMLYGPPDYIERMMSESDVKPHEIWRYDTIESGVDFIFLDRGGFSEYELVHSDKRGEIYNPDWMRLAQ